MKFQIKHECRGRIRVQAVQQRMTLEQADMLEAWLLTLPQVECASVHERTRCAVIEYQGDRKDLLRILAGFSYQDHALAELVPVHSSRALNRAYEEKLVGMVAFKAVRSLFFPAPLRAVYTVIRSAPYLFRALRCLLRRQLHVELLDGISVCLSMVRRDFDTASSVMFLLRLGELLEEWTHKKSVENLARSMSLNIDRVWMKTESGEELVPLHQVQAGDQVVIRMGGMIPLDGHHCGGRGHAQPGVPHRRVHPRPQAAWEQRLSPERWWRRASASLRSPSSPARAAMTRSWP